MSEILFLGTGAADWDINEKSGFFRRNSAALLNNDLMIDCGAHIFDFAEDFADGTLYDGVTDIMITHNHSDHFNKESVLTLAKKRKIRVLGDAQIEEALAGAENIEFIRAVPYAEQKLGRYSVIPMLANHDIVADGDKFALHYIIKTPDGKTLFYGCDGAWLLRPTWNKMLEYKFDLMVFDCTVGDSDDWRLFEHNTIPMLRTMLKEVREKEMIKAGGKAIASHLARTLHVSHEETVKILEKLDMLTAFDGMKTEF